MASGPPKFGRWNGPFLFLILNFWFLFGMVNAAESSESSTSAPHHKLSVTGTEALVQAIQCRRLGNPSTTDMNMDMSFSIVECATRTECEEKLPCLRYNLNCAHREKVFRGEACSASSSSMDKNLNVTTTTPGSDTTNDNCLVIDTKSVKYGLVECESRSKDNLTIHRTTDYFYKGVANYLYLVSNISEQSGPNSSTLVLGIEKSSIELNLNDANPLWNHLIYTAENIAVICTITEFFYDSKTLKLTLLDKTGAPFEMNEKLSFTYNRQHGKRSRGWYELQLPVEIGGVRCSVEGRNDSVVPSTSLAQRREETITFTVVDPPLDLTAKSMEEDGKMIHFNLNQSLGCKLTNASTEERSQLNRKVFLYVWGEKGDQSFEVRSIIDFLRLKQFSKGAYGCKILDGHHVLQNSKLHFDYIVTIVLDPPKILNGNSTNDGDDTTKNFVTLTGHDHRRLKCIYHGIPTPYVIWLRDGQDILEPTTYWDRSYANFDVQEYAPGESDLYLPPMMVMEMDQNGSKNKKSGVVVNYTCVAKSHLGRASFSFLIANDVDGGGGQSNLSFDQSHNDNCLAISWLLALMTLAFFVTLAISMRPYWIRILLQKYGKEDLHQLQMEEQQQE